MSSGCRDKAPINGPTQPSLDSYLWGKGVPENPTEAVQWWKQAAEQGVAEAQNNLGSMYAEGIGVPKDPTKAVKWYKRAAEQGYAGAQYILGYLLSIRGQGISQDPVEAIMWYKRVAEQGLTEAQFRLGLLYDKGTDVLPTDATSCFPIEASPRAEGPPTSVPQDPKEAATWYKRAAEQGSCRGAKRPWSTL